MVCAFDSCGLWRFYGGKLSRQLLFRIYSVLLRIVRYYSLRGNVLPAGMLLCGYTNTVLPQDDGGSPANINIGMYSFDGNRSYWAYFRKFYLLILATGILQTRLQKYLVVLNYEIWKSRFPNLTWTHIFRTLRVGDETAIRWYLENASQMWSVRSLNQICTTCHSRASPRRK